MPSSSSSPTDVRPDAPPDAKPAGALLDGLPVAVIGLTRHAVVRTANARALDLLQYRAGDLDGQAFQTLVVGDGCGTALEDWNGQKLRLRRGDGSTVDVAIEAGNGADPEEPQIWLVLRDVTVEERSGAHVREQSGFFPRGGDRLRSQRQECIGMLAGGIAHDLNNVLQPISIALDLFRARTLDEDNREILESVGSNLRRATELVRQILTFTAGTPEARQPLAVDFLFDEARGFISQTFPKTIRAGFEVAPGTPPVFGDRTQIEQVLLNLAVNARDAMPGGGRLKLAASVFEVDEAFAKRQAHAVPGCYVRLSVGDSGVGIPRALRQRIFEPFFTTKGPEKGTGLGLATSMGIIRSHGGFLTLETEEGCGTTFHVFLPAAKAEADSETSVPSEAVRIAEGHGETILVVDDEPTVLKVFQRSLEKSGYRVLTAENGEAGLEIYEAHQSEVRLVLTDLAMPGIDGPALIKELKRRDRSVRIVCTSGLAMESSDRESLGVDAVLTKPCSAREIFQTIRATLESPVSTP